MRGLSGGWLQERQLQHRERRRNRIFLWAVLIIIMVVIGIRFYWNNTFSGIKVVGTSMEHTFQTGDKVLVKKTGKWHKADYGDVIIVYVKGYKEWEGKEDERLIKRLIAKEGDKVYCVDGVVYLQKAGETQYSPLDEPYAYYTGDKSYYDFASIEDPYVVGEGEIFFLGDNRSTISSSQDSRWKEYQSQLNGKLYKESDIIGTVPEWAIKHKEKLAGIFFKE